MTNPTYRRIATDDEWHAHSRVAEYAFNGDPRDATRIGNRERWYARDWCLGAFDGDDVVAGLALLPLGIYINGGRVPLGGIASVSVLPERRRSGFVGGLLRYSLEAMRDVGEPLSALYTPHYSLYRRYGWETSSRILSYAFPPKAAKPRIAPPPGTYRRIEPDAWRDLDALYTGHMAPRNGGLLRDERWWQTHVFRDWRANVRDAVIWSDARGEPQAYAVYHSSVQHTPSSPVADTTLRVYDWIALNAEGYAAILHYLLGHDLATRIVMLAGDDEPFDAAFEEPTHFFEPNSAWRGIMLRLVDVQRAIEARPAVPQASGKGVTVALTDESAPWNAGTWRIEACEGCMSAERTDASPGLEMDVRALAPIYNGFTKPADAVRVGQARAKDEQAIIDATDVFATSFAPFTPDDF